MTARTLIALVAALILLALAAFFGTRSNAPASLVGEPLWPDLEAALADIDRVRIARAGDEPVATLERRDAHWGLAERAGYPADIGKLRTVLGALAEARIVEEKTSNPTFYARLGVEPIEEATASGVAVAAFTGERPVLAVIVGDDASGGDQYVRVADQATSYMIDRAVDVPRRTLEWLDRTIIDLPTERIQSVVIEHPDGETVRLARESQERSDYMIENIPDGRELATPGAGNVIGNALRSLLLDDVTLAGDEPPPEAVHTAFRTFDGLVVQVTAYEVGDERWITLAAEVGGSPPDANGTEAGQSAADTAREEAAAINTRVTGWRYRIPTYQYGLLTRRMDDLLRDESGDE